MDTGTAKLKHPHTGTVYIDGDRDPIHQPNAFLLPDDIPNADYHPYLHQYKLPHRHTHAHQYPHTNNNPDPK